MMSDYDRSPLLQLEEPVEGPRVQDRQQLEEPVEGPRIQDIQQREVNYGRLCKLIIREGTRRLRIYITANLSRGPKLEDLRKESRVQNIFLKLMKSHMLAPQQYKILYPADGRKLNEQDVDITLWVILARNLMHDRHLINWDKTPGPQDDLLPHHILRLRELRNRIHHIPHNELSDAEFEDMWHSAASSLRKLGSTDQDLDEIRTCDLDPEKTKMYALELQQQTLSEQCQKLEKEATHKRWLLGGFVCLLALLLVASATIIVFIVYITQPQSCADNVANLPTNDGLVPFMSRSGWGAVKAQPGGLTPFQGPVQYLVVSQTAFIGECMAHDQCCRDMRLLQNYTSHQKKFQDTPFSYFIGGDGVVYEGLGRNFQPETARGRNSEILSIGFMGYFTTNTPSVEAMHSAQLMITWLVDQRALKKNSTVLGLCQMRSPFPNTPGVGIMNAMMKWPAGDNWAWRNYNISNCDGVEQEEE